MGDLVLYVYECGQCGHKGGKHLAGDDHEGEHAKCAACDTEVVLDWDGGVVMMRSDDTPIPLRRD